MSSKRSVPVVWPRPQILHLPSGVVSHAAAEDSISLAESAGLVLDESQRFTVRSWMGERADGSWAAFEAVHAMARQNGKGGELEVRQLGGLFVLGEDLAIHTAHEFATANEHFLRVVALIEGSNDLSRKVLRVRYANGEQGIELRSGARLKFRARTGGAGRGFAGVATVYYDEAMFLVARMVGATLSTLSTTWNPQVVYTGSGGFATSSQMWALRRRALSGAGGRLAYLEHTAESVQVVNDRVVSDRDGIVTGDRRVWADVNPAMLAGRIGEEFVSAEHEAMSRDEFLRERLCVWEPEPSIENRERVFTTAQWLANVYEGAEVVRPEAVGIHVSADRLTAAVGFCASGDDGRRHVGVMDHRPGQGLGWLLDRVEEIRLAAPGIPVCVNPRSDAGSFVAELERGGAVVSTSAAEFAGACGGFFDAVLEGTVRYRRQGSLDRAVELAGKRSLAGSFAWDAVGDDISPFVAVTLAHFAHRLVPAKSGAGFALVL